MQFSLQSLSSYVAEAESVTKALVEDDNNDDVDYADSTPRTNHHHLQFVEGQLSGCDGWLGCSKNNVHVCVGMREFCGMTLLRVITLLWRL